jgi:hypothetical protein
MSFRHARKPLAELENTMPLIDPFRDAVFRIYRDQSSQLLGQAEYRAADWLLIGSRAPLHDVSRDEEGAFVGWKNRLTRRRGDGGSC